jgi:hypothetical protein
MKKYTLFIIIFFFVCRINAQLGIGTVTPNPSAVLDLSSTTKGLLLPRMTALQLTNLVSPAIELTVYNTSTNQITE